MSETIAGKLAEIRGRLALEENNSWPECWAVGPGDVQFLSDFVDLLQHPEQFGIAVSRDFTRTIQAFLDLDAKATESEARG